MKTLKIKSIAKYTVMALCAASALSITGCKKEKTNPEDAVTLSVSKANEQKIKFEDTVKQWHVTNKRIFVLYGYAFNDEETIKKFDELLQDRYGLDSDGGLICTLTYPDSFKHNGKSYSSELYSILSETEKEIAGVVILGAPETTHIALGRLQDFWDMQIPYPIIALFPQDDVSGLQSTCDIVIDKSQKVDISGDVEPEEIEAQPVEEAAGILKNTLDYIITLNGSIAKDSDMAVHVSQLLQNYSYSNYVDSETGLKSINHFILH